MATEGVTINVKCKKTAAFYAMKFACMIRAKWILKRLHGRVVVRLWIDRRVSSEGSLVYSESGVDFKWTEPK
jgi:hypothetical protein